MASSTELRSSQLIATSITTKQNLDTANGDNCAIEFWRGAKTSWQIANEDGYLYIRNNYNGTKLDTYAKTSIKVAPNEVGVGIPNLSLGTEDLAINDSYSLYTNGQIYFELTENTIAERELCVGDKTSNYMSIAGTGLHAWNGTMQIQPFGGNLIVGQEDNLVTSTLNGSLSVTRGIGLASTDTTTGLGISLYDGPSVGKPPYGLFFGSTETFGKLQNTNETYGISSDTATYLTMYGASGRGWIFLHGNTSVAAINGYGTFISSATSGTHDNAGKGRVALDLTASAGFNMAIRVKSTNGVFLTGGHNSNYIVEYLTDANVTSSTNAASSSVVLINEDGYSKFNLVGINCVPDSNFNLKVDGNASINGTLSIFPSHYYHYLWSNNEVYEHMGLNNGTNATTAYNGRVFKADGGYFTFRFSGSGFLSWDGGYTQLKADHDFMYHGNEFTFVPSAFTQGVWFNWRTQGGTNGDIPAYYFGDGKGGQLANISRGQFSGNAATATKLTSSAGSTGQPVYFNDGKPEAIDWHIGNANVGEHNANNITYNMIGYYNSNGPAETGTSRTTGVDEFSSTDGSIYAQGYNSNWVGQIAQDYRTGLLSVRSKNNGTWQAWKMLATNPAHYGTTAGGGGQFYKVRIKRIASWMLSFTLRIYQSYASYDVLISGYWYGSNHWYSPQAVMLGSSTTSALNIKFGYDSDNSLWIGFAAGDYTGVTILGVNNGFYQLNDWNSQFEITKVAALGGTEQTNINAYRPWYRNETVDKANSATSAASAIKVMDSSNTMALYAEYNNEVNFGGTNTSGTIYFGYRAKDSKPVPSVFYFGGSTGTATIRAAKVYGAVWNDYAEYRESNENEPGRVVYEVGDDTLTRTTERLQHFAGVTSDTWGFAQGETEKAKTPIAVAGRVLVYTYQDRNNYKPGDCVCAAPNGTVDIMSRLEVVRYPDRIVGTVSCVPDYETWGGILDTDRESVLVNNRIWIKVR